MAMMVGVVIVSSGSGAGAQFDDEDLLLGQEGDARIVFPADGDTVTWPFTMIIEADTPGLPWTGVEAQGYNGPPEIIDDFGSLQVLFDENGRIELPFDGPAPAIPTGGEQILMEIFGWWDDPNSGDEGFFFDDTVFTILPPARTAPTVTIDEFQSPTLLPITITGSATSSSAIDGVEVLMNEATTNVTLDPDGTFTLDVHGYNSHPKDRVELLLRVVDAAGSQTFERIEIVMSEPEIAFLDVSMEYPFTFSGTVAAAKRVDDQLIEVEIDWPVSGYPEQYPTVHADGTWSYTFDPRLTQGWVWEPGSTMRFSFRVRDRAGRSTEIHQEITPPPHFLYCYGYGVTVDLLAGDVPTDGPDVILGGPLRDRINAGGGDDVICSLGGWDIIDAGPGNDTIIAGLGNDQIIGGDGRDSIIAGWGADTVDAGDGDDEVSGGRGNDTIELGEGNDFATGNEGNDKIYGGAGNDELFGRIGFDRLEGGGGNDLLVGGVGPDKIFGEAGADEAYGEAGRDRIDMGGGKDLAIGGDGDDIIFGGPGDDRLGGGDGDDIIHGNEQQDLAVGGAGTDTCTAEFRRECEQ